ncbi:hypothetical protein AGMMS50293_20290 [Spirochaetia bacterium]|nr:hypothetical protein AGMMS50293_20290 [Spirochaetia bacterium]
MRRFFSRLILCAYAILTLLIFGCAGQDVRSADAGAELGEDLPPAAESDVEVFPHVPSYVNSAVYSPDGKHILSAHADKAVRIWDSETGALARTLYGHTDMVRSAAYSPDGKYIVSGAEDNTVIIWDAEGRKIHTLGDHTNWVYSVSFSPDGNRIVSASSDRTIKIWDTKTGRLIHNLEDKIMGSVTSASFSPDGSRIASGSRDGMVRIWDAETGDRIWNLHGHNNVVWSTAWSPDGKRIVSGSQDNTARIWDVETLQEIGILKDFNREVYSAVFSPDGKYIVTASPDDTGRQQDIVLWDAETGERIRNFRGHQQTVFSAAFSPDGECIVSASGDSSIKIWNTGTGEEIRSMEAGETDMINTTVISRNGNLIASGSESGTINLWDLAAGGLIRTFAHGDSAYCLAFSPDGRFIVSGGREHDIGNESIKIWGIETGSEAGRLDGHTNTVFGLAYSNDGSRMVSASGDGTLRVWDAKTGSTLHVLRGHTAYVYSAAFSADGKRIVSASRDNTARIWDAETGQELQQVPSAHTGIVFSAAFSPDGKRVVTASFDETIKIWNAETVVQPAPISDINAVRSVAFSPDGKYIVSGNNNYEVKIWEAATGNLVRTISGFRGAVKQVSYDTFGKRIIAGSVDGTVRVFDAATGNEIAAFIAFKDGEWIVVTPDGYYNASPKGDQHLNVRIGDEVYGIDQFAESFYHPEVVQARLRGDKDPPVVKQRGSIKAASVPPALKVTVVNDGKTTGQAVLSITATDQIRQIKDIEIIVNGRLVGGNELQAVSAADGTAVEAEDRRFPSGLTPTLTRLTTSSPDKQFEFTISVKLDPGSNIIEIVAANDYNYGIKPIYLDGPQNDTPLRGDLWILAVGVNDYANNGPGSNTGYYDLKNPADDARKIIRLFESQQGEGKRFNQVHVLCVSDNDPEKPTKQAILDRMDFLKQAGPDDTALLFMSGHGKTEEGIYYFLPHDTVFTGGDKFDPASAVNVEDLTRALDLPGRKIIMLDTCESGGIDTNRLVRTLKNRSTVVFTASQAGEFAIENTLYGGFFVYSIVEGIGGKAVREERRVPLTSLGNYISERVGELSRDRQTGAVRQHPMKYIPDGYRDFIISVLGN